MSSTLPMLLQQRNQQATQPPPSTKPIDPQVQAALNRQQQARLSIPVSVLGTHAHVTMDPAVVATVVTTLAQSTVAPVKEMSDVARSQSILVRSMPTPQLKEKLTGVSEAQLQAEKIDLAVTAGTLLGATFISVAVPATIAGHRFYSAAARTALMGGLGGAGGYVLGGPEGAVKGALLAGGTTALFEAGSWVYRYAKTPKVPSRGFVDEPLPASVPEYQSIESTPKEAIQALGPSGAFDYPEGITPAGKEAIDLGRSIETGKVSKAYDPLKLFKPSALEAEPVSAKTYADYLENIGGFDWTPEQKAAYTIETGKLKIPVPESAEHVSWKFPLSYAEQAEPLKLIGIEELMKTPEAYRAIMTAEKLGLGVPKTALIDPAFELLETPTLDRPIAGMPYMPKPELTARLQPSSASAFLSLLGMGAAKESARPSLMYESDVAMMQEPLTSTKQAQALQAALKTVQLQQQVQETRQLQQMSYPSLSIFGLQDFPYRFPSGDLDWIPKRRKRRGGYDFLGLKGLEWPVGIIGEKPRRRKRK